jgi:hypothetical protein
MSGVCGSVWLSLEALVEVGATEISRESSRLQQLVGILFSLLWGIRRITRRLYGVPDHHGAMTSPLLV